MTIRVAVCMSGAYRTKLDGGSLLACNAIVKAKFPDADFYYATWEQFKPEFEKDFPLERCEYFDEPAMRYHPYLDIPLADHISERYQTTADFMNASGHRIKWTSHHTKQILIHTWLSDKIKEQYDVIVRARFDQYLYEGADFTPYIKDTHENDRANCFLTTRPFRFPTLLEPKDQNAENTARNETWMFDSIIIHPANAIDADSVMCLHKEGKLHAAEYGWYQVISMPHGSRHMNYNGWAAHDSVVDPKFMWSP